MGSVPAGPKSISGHGSNCNSYQVVALKEPVDVKKLSPMATKKELAS